MFEKKIGGGKTPKWMVKIMENLMNKWMIWGFYHYFWVDTHIEVTSTIEGTLLWENFLEPYYVGKLKS